MRLSVQSVVLILASGFVLLSGVFVVQRSMAHPQSDLECLEPEFDFGTLTHGDNITHRFTIVNNGRRLIRIKDVRPSCGCVVPRLPKDVLQPGEVTEMIVRFESATVKVDKSVNAAILVTLDGEDVSPLTLRMRGRIVNGINEGTSE